MPPSAWRRISKKSLELAPLSAACDRRPPGPSALAEPIVLQYQSAGSQRHRADPTALISRKIARSHIVRWVAPAAADFEVWRWRAKRELIMFAGGCRYREHPSDAARRDEVRWWAPATIGLVGRWRSLRPAQERARSDCAPTWSLCCGRSWCLRPGQLSSF